MKIETAKPDLINGTALVGAITDVTYQQLVAAFGEPAGGDGYKTRVEWSVLIDGVIATIYDWKRPEPLEAVKIWNVGGRNQSAVTAVRAALEAA